MSKWIRVKAAFIRLSLVLHAFISAWHLVETNENSYGWLILVGLVFLIVESFFVLFHRNGREFPAVAFCLIFYLTCTAPALWIFQVNTANKKLIRLAETKLKSVLRTTTPLILSLEKIDCHDKAWAIIEDEHLVNLIEETMFVLISISRFLISLDRLNVEQSGVVLILTLIHSADFIAISQALQYHDVVIERLWLYIGLVLLTIGLFRLTLIDADGLILIKKPSRQRFQCFPNRNFDVLFRSLFTHDGLLFLYRIFLAAQVRCGKASLIFFLVKNLLMILRHFHQIYYYMRKPLTSSAVFNDSSTSSSSSFAPLQSVSPSRGRFQIYKFRRRKSSIVDQESRLIHRTIRRISSIVHRRKVRSPQTFYQYSSASIFYPFARRQRDGGQTRTAIALYGLPFPTPQLAQRAETISSINSSHLAKTLLF